MQLLPHPDTTIATVERIDAAVWQSEGRWHFRYLIEGIDDVAWPDQQVSGRADELWKHTCLEAFVQVPGGGYVELNFSPSSQWAAYRFDTYRTGMREESAEVEVWIEGGESWFALEAAVTCAALTAGSSLGLSAVIEETGGRKSYWALGHPDGPPDFHDRACFRALLADIAQS